MAVRRREDGVQVGEVVPGFPYPYGTDLHWLWGWGHRIEDFLDKETFKAGSADWIVIRACRDAADAMMRYSIDYPAVIEEVKRCQRDVENRWDEALNLSDDSTTGAYIDSLEVLSARIFKACELIAEREIDSTPQSDDEATTDEESRRNTRWRQLQIVVDTWSGNLFDLKERPKILKYYNENFAGKPCSWDSSKTNPEATGTKVGDVVRKKTSQLTGGK